MADQTDSFAGETLPGLDTGWVATSTIAPNGLPVGAGGESPPLHNDQLQNSTPVPEPLDCPAVGSHFRGVPGENQSGASTRCPWCGFGASN